MEGPSEFERAREHTEGKSSIELLDLPPELWRHAAVFAHYRDLMSLCATSRALREEVCGNNFFWRNKTYHDFGGLYPINEETEDWRKAYEDFRRKRTISFLDHARLKPASRQGWFVDDEAFRILEDDFQRGILDLEFRDTEGRTPLIQAILTSSTNVIRNLLDLGTNVNAKDHDGKTALMYATSLHRNNILEDLLRAGADVNLKDKVAETVLMIAAEFGYPEFAELFLRYGADPNLQNTFGTTALIFASERGWIEVVRILLANGADVSLRDNFGDRGRTAIDWADANGHTEIAELLLQYGAGSTWRRASRIMREFAEEYGGL